MIGRLFKLLVALSLLLLVLSSATASDTSPTSIELALLPKAIKASVPALAQDEPPAQTRVFLPIIDTGPAVAIRFGSGFNQETFELLEPGERFVYGLRRLYIETTYRNADFMALQRVLSYPDGREERSDLVTIEPDEGGRLAVYCLRPTTSQGCDNAAILPLGTYTYTVYLNDILFVTANVVVE